MESTLVDEHRQPCHAFNGLRKISPRALSANAGSTRSSDLPSGYDLSSARNSTGQGKRKLKKTVTEMKKKGQGDSTNAKGSPFSQRAFCYEE
jgi:hypothetical protein